MILHDHSKISYRRAPLDDCGYLVFNDNEWIGYVRRARDAWEYRSRDYPWWTLVGGTRKDAADHLLSARSPSSG